MQKSNGRQQPDIDRGLADRLSTLVNRFSQAAIARRLGEQQSNISRYLKGTRIPASFCSKVATEFGINGHWLLCGQGEPELRQRQTQDAALTGLLELMSAANAARRTALTAAQNSHTLALRDLAKRVEDANAIQQKLVEALQKPLQRALNDIDEAMSSLDLERAQRLIGEVAPLVYASGDPNVIAKLEHARALVATHGRRFTDAVEACRRELIIRGAARLPISADDLVALRDISVLVSEEGYVDDALCVCEMGEALARSMGILDPHWLRFARGMLLFRKGELYAGQALMQEAARDVRADAMLRANAYLTTLALYAGTRGIDEELLLLRGLPPARGRDMAMSIRCNTVLTLAVWLRNPETLREAYAVYRRHAQVPGKTLAQSVYVAETLVQALRAKKPSMYDNYVASHEAAIRTDTTANPMQLFESHVRGAIIAEAAGHPALVDEVMKAAAARATLPRGMYPRTTMYAHHAELVLQLKSSESTPKKKLPGDAVMWAREAEWAKQYIETAASKGYRLLKKSG